METDKAILAFSQSEKIKAGLIWISQALELLQGLYGAERKGGEIVLDVMLRMISQETQLARTVVDSEIWDEMDIHLGRAVSMVNSGVGHEATIHLSRALSQVTNIGLQSMTALREKDLLKK